MRRLALLPLLAACGDGAVKLGDAAPDTPVTGETSTGPADDTGGPADDTGGTLPLLPDWTVDCTGGADFERIQDAIDASVSGDRIGVAPCTYHERLDWRGKSVDVYGMEGSAVTILDADLGGTAVNVETGEGDGTRFAGFTVRGGMDALDGSAIEVAGAVLELEDVVLEQNGDGLYVLESLGGLVDARDLVVRDDALVEGGAAILADGGSFVGERLDVDCGTGAAALYAHVALELTDSVLACDGGVGIDNHHGELNIRRSRVTGGLTGIYTYDEAGTPEEPDDPSERILIANSAIGGGSLGLDVWYEHLELTNSVVWGGTSAVQITASDPSSFILNSALVESGCGLTADAAYDVRYGAFHGNGADGCGVAVTPTVTDDPEFASFPDDLTLGPRSPLADAGSPQATWNDLDGTRNDIGMYGGPWSVP